MRKAARWRQKRTTNTNVHSQMGCLYVRMVAFRGTFMRTEAKSAAWEFCDIQKAIIVYCILDPLRYSQASSSGMRSELKALDPYALNCALLNILNISNKGGCKS